MAYDPPKFKNKIDLKLSANESQCPIHDLPAQLAKKANFVSFYPDHVPLQESIGTGIGVENERIVVTAGGDDAIDRVMRHSLRGSRKKIVCHVPSFEMISIYASMYGGQISSSEWLGGEFPINEFLSRIDSETAIVVIVTPNNPTGGSISVEHVVRIAEEAKAVGVDLLVDNAYVEFADTDPTETISKLDNVLIVRTFSKAIGLAGLRVGYLIAPNARHAAAIRDSSGPYPVSSISLEMARVAVESYAGEMQSLVNSVKQSRTLLSRIVASCGGSSIDSQGNFILAAFDNAEHVWQQLAQDGIGVRIFPNNDLLAGHLRITCPTNRGDLIRLGKSIARACKYPGDIVEEIIIASDYEYDNRTFAEKPSENPGAFAASTNRTTKETAIEIELDLYGQGKTEISTGIGFLDHMLTALAFHSGMNLKLKCDGDIHIDDHHTAEDCALALGNAIDQALGHRSGIKRFGYAYAPLDESLARTVIDLSGRPWPAVNLKLQREMVGTWACENIVHFFQSLAMSLKCSLHVDVIRGDNDHHKAEAAFKSLAKALHQALTRTSGSVPSTKGVL